VAHTTVPTVDRAPAPNIVFLRPCIHEHQKQQMQAAEDKGKRCNAPLTVWDTPKLTLGSRAASPPAKGIMQVASCMEVASCKHSTIVVLS
jgi:hypothetical protein